MLKQLLFAALWLCATTLVAQQLNTEVFSVLNLDYPGLEKVKQAHAAGDNTTAAAELLNYYRTRTAPLLPDVDMNNINISKTERLWADESLEHKFFAHRGYQPSYFYGKDIDWTFWPVKDNELRWQLHRHKWFTPLGKAFRTTGDEKYAQAWTEHYLDWIQKNPYPSKKSKRKTIGAPSDNPQDDNLRGEEENERFSWRPLEASERINSQPEQFLLFLPSEHFTPEFLSHFLVSYNLHGNHIMSNYSKQGNHLLFEAQRLFQAGVFFPELKIADTWRSEGVRILNKEIGVQVYDDGMQYELDPHYHLAAINIFFSALQVADMNGYRSSFPDSYINTIEKMITVFMNMSFPDYSDPLFSDNRRHSKSSVIKNYKRWLPVYPNNEHIRYLATEGREGKQPDYTSRAFRTSGFYMLRNGWDMSSTAMVLKAGPPAFWHNQPDNGTFDLFINGRNFFMDSGCYVYGGDAEVLKQRDWFRQTMIHKTLTLDNRNLEKTDSRCLLWTQEGNTDIVVVENPSYEGLTHRRSIFFVDKHYFVIVDEATGSAQGKVGIHFQMGEDNVLTSPKENKAYTTYSDNNNVVLRTFSATPLAFEKEEGWISYEYRKKFERAAFSFNIDKKDDTPSRFVTIILPTKQAKQAPALNARLLNSKEGEMKVEVTIGEQKRTLSYSLNQ